MHLSAMLSLVTDPVVLIRSETVPETLLNDAHRLSLIQVEYDRIVSGATLLAMASHAIVGADKRVILSEIAELIVGGRSDFETIITTELCEKLDASRMLVEPGERTKALRLMLSGVNNKDDAVRQLM